MNADELPPHIACAADVWEWIRRGYVWTKREDSDTDTEQRLPPKPYYWDVIRLYQGTHPCYADPYFTKVNTDYDPNHWLWKKSRRMQFTWLTAVIDLHSAMYNDGVAIGVGSKKEKDADWLLRHRYDYIYERLPEECFAGGKPTVVRTAECVREYSNGSILMAQAQGPDIWRQFTYSDVHLDEVSFWPDFIETYAGLRPATKRSIALSSPREGSGFKTTFEDDVQDDR